MQTQAVEDYLKTIFEIERTEGKVATTILAERLGVAPASVTGMIKKLAAMDLVRYKRYQGVQLTQAGRRIALEVIRHHRLVELYLAEALGVPWDRVHEEAEKWEHVLSEDVEARMDVVLGHPTVDPHGSPIPTPDGQVERRCQQKLSEVPAGCRVILSEVSDHSPEILRRLGQMGLFPGTTISIQKVREQEIILQMEETVATLEKRIAEFVFVTPCEDKP